MSDTAGILVLAVFGVISISTIGIFTIYMIIKIANTEKKD